MHLTHASFGPPEFTTQRHLDRFSRFAQLIAECPYTLQWATFAHQNCPYPWGSGPPNTRFLAPARVLNPNGIWVSSTVMQGTVTDRPTDRLTDHASQSVRVGRSYVRSTGMRLNKTIVITMTVITRIRPVRAPTMKPNQRA